MKIWLPRAVWAARAVVFALLLTGLCSQGGFSESSYEASLPDAPAATANSSSQAGSVSNLPHNFLKDQEAIWTSPVRLRRHDLVWFVPLLGATGAAIATDRRAERDVVSHDPGFNDASTNASNVMIGGFIATPVVLYGVGHLCDDDHAREAGVLGAEGILDGLVVEQGMKLIFWRERPTVDHGRGRFFQSSVGVDSSFPSSHSVLAWSTAAVLASEYPNHWTQFGVYSAATGVSLARVMGQQHFPADVLVGGVAGWLVGRYVYRRHQRHLAAAH